MARSAASKRQVRTRKFGRARKALRERADQICKELVRAYPVAECALIHDSPLQLLIATILSAQCTDARVNIVTRKLFATYRTPAEFAASPPGELEEIIHSTGFFRNKAKNIRAACAAIQERFDGQVPRRMEDLLSLAGVARKTANVVLGTAWGMPSGVVVDTHVQRITGLLGLTRQTDPVKVEKDLIALLPETAWISFSHRLILHGRQVCIARRPRCADCTLSSLCESDQTADQT